MNHIPEHIDRAIASDQPIYYSTPVMYKYITDIANPRQYLVEQG